MLRAEGLTKRYGDRRALDGFDLSVQPGEITGLVGHNGAGKTTFVEVVTGLVRPDAGRVTVGGIDARRHPRAARRLIGVAPQEQALYLSATARDNLSLFGALAGLHRAGLRRAIAEVTDELLLGDVLAQRVGLLSGGQRRRVQAATAMIGSPRLLLLDEPTAGADPDTRTALLAAVRARAAAGTAIVYTTHYLPELADLGATLAVARAGRVIARGTQHSLISGLPGELRLRFGGSSFSTDTDTETGAVRADHPALPAALAGRSRKVGDELAIASTDPPADLAAVLAAGCSPTAVDVRKPDLDDLYRALALEVSHAA
ncbi:MAG TPA: ABC transporter ATP-binding protein [Streptosporangiaceae bacterium]|nr:ABC transporter ATP-binding protein [Streptosporangiaceae bacterium]